MGYIVTATFLIAIVRQGDARPAIRGNGLAGDGARRLPVGVLVEPRRRPDRAVCCAYMLACLVEAAGVTASVAAGGLYGPLIGGILLGGTFIAATSLGLRLAQLLAPLSARRALALMTASFGVGQIAGPVIAGLVAEWSGSFFLPSLGAAVALLASALIVWSADAPQ